MEDRGICGWQKRFSQLKTSSTDKSSKVTFRERERSLSRSPIDIEKYGEIPIEFFCPISKEVISDPVRTPKSDYTYDRDSVKDLHNPEDVQPDLRMRNMIEDWFSHYDLHPPFDFISNQDDLLAASKSVVAQLNEDLLREFSRAIEDKPWLMYNGGRIRCVDTLLSYPRENHCDAWVASVLSIVAHSIDDDEILQVPAGVYHQYSLLTSISRACESQLRTTNGEEFQMGMINLMHGLVINSPDLSAMSEKLGGIVGTLVSYVWPVKDHFIQKRLDRKLLSTLERLSDDQESCKNMVSAEIIGLLFVLLDFGVSPEQELVHDIHKETTRLALGLDEDDGQLRVIYTTLKILDGLCCHSELAVYRVEQMGEDEFDGLTKAIYICSVMEEKESIFMGVRVLDRCHLYPTRGFLMGSAISIVRQRREDQHGDDVIEKPRLNKWRSITGVIDWRRCLRKNPQEVKRRIRHGVPDWFCGTTWQLILGGHEFRWEHPPVDYAELRLHEMSEFEKLCIVKDIPRTLKYLPLSQTYSGSLYNVLKAYDVYDRAHAGYIHGMSYIAGLLLLHMEEKATFLTLVRLLKKPAMEGIYSKRALLLDQYLFQFGMLVKEQLPMLDDHFQEQRILLSLYACRWFLTVFTADLPIPLVVWIWDIFLYEGIDIIFQVGMALLKYFAKNLLIYNKERLIKFLLTMKKRRESLLREFARAIKYKPCLLKNEGRMWCVAMLLSYPRPSVSWVSTALSIVAHIDKDENLLVPAGIDIGIHPDYSLLQTIKEALVYDEHESVLSEDFKSGFTNFIHGLIMNCPDILSMEGKMGVVLEALVRNMWPVPESFEFSWYLRQLLTVEHLSESAEFRGRMFQSGVIWMLLLVMNSRVSSIEENQENRDPVVTSLTIGTCMRTLEKLYHQSPRARRQLWQKVFSAVRMLCVSLPNQLKVVGDYVVGSDFLAQFLDELGKALCICIAVLPQDLPLILDKPCNCSVQAREQIEHMADPERKLKLNELESKMKDIVDEENKSNAKMESILIQCTTCPSHPASQWLLQTKQRYHYNATITRLVKKEDRSNRLCIDYRWLNQTTIKDEFFTPKRLDASSYKLFLLEKFRRGNFKEMMI